MVVVAAKVLEAFYVTDALHQRSTEAASPALQDFFHVWWTGKLCRKTKIVWNRRSPPFCHEKVGWTIKGRINLNKIKNLAIVLQKFPSV
jgi:hypothetical protein